MQSVGHYSTRDMSSDGIGIASEVATFAIDHTSLFSRQRGKLADKNSADVMHEPHTCPAFLCLSCLSEPWRIRAGIKFLHASYNHLNHKLRQAKSETPTGATVLDHRYYSQDSPSGHGDVQARNDEPTKGRHRRHQTKQPTAIRFRRRRFRQQRGCGRAIPGKLIMS